LNNRIDENYIRVKATTYKKEGDEEKEEEIKEDDRKSSFEVESSVFKMEKQFFDNTESTIFKNFLLERRQMKQELKHLD